MTSPKKKKKEMFSVSHITEIMEAIDSIDKDFHFIK